MKVSKFNLDSISDLSEKFSLICAPDGLFGQLCVVSANSNQGRLKKQQDADEDNIEGNSDSSENFFKINAQIVVSGYVFRQIKSHVLNADPFWSSKSS